MLSSKLPLLQEEFKSGDHPVYLPTGVTQPCCQHTTATDQSAVFNCDLSLGEHVEVLQKHLDDFPHLYYTIK